LKGLFVSAIVAMALHALLLSVRTDWGKVKRLSPPSPMVLSLSYKTPEARQAPPPEPVREPPKKPAPPAPAKSEERDKRFVSEPKPTPPKKKPPLKVPKERPAEETPPLPRTAEWRATADETAKVEAEIPSPPASTEKQPSTLSSSQSLAAKPNSEVKRAYAREAVPLYLKNPPPEYPPTARRRGYEGTVVMEVFVDREGRVRDLTLFQSSGHKVLDRAAMEAVRGWLFEPARLGEEKVDMWVKVPLTFRLR
jgi:protein TonB